MAQRQHCRGLGAPPPGCGSLGVALHKELCHCQSTRPTVTRAARPPRPKDLGPPGHGQWQVGRSPAQAQCRRPGCRSDGRASAAARAPAGARGASGLKRAGSEPGPAPMASGRRRADGISGAERTQVDSTSSLHSRRPASSDVCCFLSSPPSLPGVVGKTGTSRGVDMSKGGWLCRKHTGVRGLHPPRSHHHGSESRLK